MSDFFKFLRCKYSAGSFIKEISIIAFVSCVFVFVYMRIFAQDFYAGICAKDILFDFSSVFTFPIITGISTINILMATFIDGNPNIIIRYHSKRKIFLYQALMALIIALIDIIIMYASATICCYLVTGCYDNWFEKGSRFYTLVKRKKLTLYIGISDFEIYLNMVIRKTLLVWMITLIALVVEYLTDQLIIAILLDVIICGVSVVSKYGITILDLRVLNLYDINKTIMYHILTLFICIVLLILGMILSKRRQYYR